jgi:rhodanese-related sulfurtransferase
MYRTLIFVCFLSTLIACKSQPQQTITKVDVTEFSERITIDNIQLVDVRTPEEYAEGHIENALLINFKSDDFEEKIQELDKDKPVYVYCKSGNRSGQASEIMKELGFKQIIDLDGGYSAWSKK